MLDLEDRLDELNQLGLHQRMRMVSGPQGPRVVLDGRPVLLLCSGNALGLADHPKVRQAAADAAMRWGVGRRRIARGERHDDPPPAAGGAARDVHRPARGAAVRVRRAGQHGRDRVRSRGAARSSCTTSSATARSLDGCRLSGADVVAYRHGDADHLAWTLRQCDGRATLIATDGMFGMDGDVAPLAEIVELARRYDIRVLVDEAHALGVLGPGGRGAVAEAGLEDEVEVVTGTLGKALGSYGGFVACDHVTARFLVHSARTLLHSTALPPVAAAAAMAALDLLEEEPRRVEKLRANAEALRDGLAREGFEVSGAAAHVVPLVVGDAERAARIVDHALELGVFAEAIRPPAVPDGTARVRVSAMASHTRAELRGAATALGRAALRAGFRPGAGLPVAAAHGLARAA